MTNWKSLVETAQAKQFVLPAGWDSRAKVAENMGCSEDAVSRIFGPLVKSGEVEVQVFPVFDKLVKRVVRVTAYRKAGGEKPAAKQSLKRDKHGHFVG